MEILRSDLVLAGMVIIALLGILVDAAFRIAGHRLGVKD
jgi:ABC-type nitrate/sulfonate/bicarbonate transport system permease component